MIWLTSDLHLGHAKIIQYCDRPFICASEMDRTLVENWQTVVKPEDEVYVIGDMSFHKADRTKELVQSLPGHKTLILGNHDWRQTNTFWEKAGFERVVDRWSLDTPSHGPIELQHHPYWGGDTFTYPILFHGHAHGTMKARKIVSNGRVMLNFSVECWQYFPVPLDEALKTVDKVRLEFEATGKTSFKVGEV